MHELWICQNIFEIVNQQAVKQSCVRVKRVYLEIGQLTMIEKSALTLCFNVVSKGTVAENAVLEIIEIPGSARCDSCQQTVSVSQYYDYCRYCQNFSLTIMQGQELRIKSMEVE
ncbi:MAG: hydrogenase nickel incorporation protein HypA [uncultured bacterium]|nr:MAG: hydrogenase nickel incorporation protein HypA [uncultured bacterium]OGT55410.1 MAG: hydrogenase maturation nickel metallochaperone HypA [Gammaproteobacteria bacterium RIFCSPHIGHO2_12_FULL_42_10]